MHPHRVVLDVLSALCRLGRRPRHGECRGFVASLVFFFCNKREYKYKYEPLSRTRSALDMYRSSNRVHQLRHLQPLIKMWHWTPVCFWFHVPTEAMVRMKSRFIDTSDELIFSCQTSHKELFYSQRNLPQRTAPVIQSHWRGIMQCKLTKVHYLVETCWNKSELWNEEQRHQPL